MTFPERKVMEKILVVEEAVITGAEKSDCNRTPVNLW